MTEPLDLEPIRQRVENYPWGYPAASHPAEDRRALVAEVDRLRADLEQTRGQLRAASTNEARFSDEIAELRAGLALASYKREYRTALGLDKPE